MKQVKSLKLIYLTCAGVLLSSSPCFSMGFPTFDIAEVTNTITQVSTQVESVQSTVDSTMSTSKIQQALGDNVGGLSKFTDDPEDAKKKQKKLEKKRKRAERLAKLRDKIKKGKELYNKGKDAYEEGQGYYEQGKDAYEQGEEYYNQGMGYVEEGKNQLNAMNGSGDEESAEASGDSDDFAVSSASGGFEKSPATDGRRPFVEAPSKNLPSVNVPSQNRPAYVNQAEEFHAEDGEVMLDNNEIADLVSDSEFSEGNWDPENAVSAEIGAGEAIIDADKAVLPAPAVERLPFKQGEAMKLNNRPDVAVESKGVLAPEGSLSLTKDTAIEKAVAPVKAVVSDNAIAPKKTLEPMTMEAPKKILEPAKVNAPIARKAFQKVSANGVFVYTVPMSFAQEASGEYKTGTTDDGKFVYSDKIANSCGINFDEMTEEKALECVKTFVFGMNDPNSVKKMEWIKTYKSALHDHVVADVAMAIQHKTYAATFEAKVAEDLDNKSKALTNEREEVGFSGKVNSTNQEVIIRLMEAMTGQVITDAWRNVEGIDIDALKEDQES